MIDPERYVREESAVSSAETGPSRRGFLGGLASASAVLAASGGVVGARQGDEQFQPEVVADFEPPNLPENIAVDGDGNVYLSMAPIGEIHRIAPDGSASTVATLDVGENGSLLGITAAADGTIHAALASGNPETHGVWLVNPEGGTEQVASLPPDETMPNGIIHDPYRSGAVLVADHLGGAVWRVTPDGTAEEWVAHPLLEPNPYAAIPVGADGIAVHPSGDIFVDNLSYGGVVRIPVESGGAAGTPEVYLQDDALVGCDGMTFDEEGNLYVAVNTQNEVVRVTPEQEIETLVSGGDLDAPADVHFGRSGTDAETTLYFCNFAIGSFQAEDRTANPSLMRIDVEARGFFPEQGEFAEAEPGTDATEENVTEDDVTEGNVTEGNVTEGNVTDGNVTDGNVTDGNVTDGNMTNVTDGNATDGNVTDGNVTDGNVTGNATAGNATTGNTTTGNATDGT